MIEKNKDIIGNNIDDIKNTDDNFSEFNLLNSHISDKRSLIYQGGGPIAIQKQHDKQRMTCRERIKYLLDPGTDFLKSVLLLHMICI